MSQPSRLSMRLALAFALMLQALLPLVPTLPVPRATLSAALAANATPAASPTTAPTRTPTAGVMLTATPSPGGVVSPTATPTVGATQANGAITPTATPGGSQAAAAMAPLGKSTPTPTATPPPPGPTCTATVGTICGWGTNTWGELGDGTGYSRLYPVGVLGPGGTGPLTGVTAVATGMDHTAALRVDGTVWTFGQNDYGALGNNSTTSQSTPVQVLGPNGQGTLTGIIAIAAGYDFVLALRNDGTVWAWGQNESGELGTASSSTCVGQPCSLVPVQVTGLTGVVGIAAGSDFSLALKGDGTVWAWGYQATGALGNGSDAPGSVTQPHAVLGPNGSGSLTGRTAIVAGAIASSSFALVNMGNQPAPAGTQYADAPYSATGGGSVNTYTGAFTYTYSHTDLAIPGRGPSPQFARSYDSGDTRVGPLGPGWTHTNAIHLANPGDGTADKILVGPQGRSDRYTAAGGSFTPPPAVYTTLIRNTDGSYTATLKDQTTWTFDGGGNLTAITDRYGNRSVLTYSAGGQLVSVSDPAGRGSLTFGYNASGQLTSVTDWANRVVQFGYDGSGRLQTYTDRDGKTTTYGYDASNRLTTITDAGNHTQITNTYDGSGRVQTQQDALGNQTTYSYGAGTTTITYPATSYQTAFQPTVTDTYDTSGRLTQRVTKPSSSESYTESFGYDAKFDLTSKTDARGATTTYCYDVDYSGGNVLVTLLKYDAKNNVLETVPPKGVASGTSASCATNFASSINTMYATDNTYDANGVALLSTTRRYTDPDSGQQTATTKYEYGDSANPGRVTRIIPPRGNTGPTPDYTYATTMAYYGSGSQAGMLQTSTDAVGNKTSYGYDAVGRQTSTVDPNGQTWTDAYDNEDRRAAASAPAPQAGGGPLTTQYQYDPVGNRIVAIDANGQVTKYAYDARNSLVEVDQSPNPWTDPNATPSPKYVTAYAYDHLGNLTRATRDQGDNANERATDYLYDGAGHLRQEIEYPSWPA